MEDCTPRVYCAIFYIPFKNSLLLQTWSAPISFWNPPLIWVELVSLRSSCESSWVCCLNRTPVAVRHGDVTTCVENIMPFLSRIVIQAQTELESCIDCNEVTLNIVQSTYDDDGLTDFLRSLVEGERSALLGDFRRLLQASSPSRRQGIRLWCALFWLRRASSGVCLSGWNKHLITMFYFFFSLETTFIFNHIPLTRNDHSYVEMTLLSVSSLSGHFMIFFFGNNISELHLYWSPYHSPRNHIFLSLETTSLWGGVSLETDFLLKCWVLSFFSSDRPLSLETARCLSWNEQRLCVPRNDLSFPLDILSLVLKRMISFGIPPYAPAVAVALFRRVTFHASDE